MHQDPSRLRGGPAASPRGREAAVSLGTGPSALIGGRWGRVPGGRGNAGVAQRPELRVHADAPTGKPRAHPVGAEEAFLRMQPSLTTDTLQRGTQGDLQKAGRAPCGPAAATRSGEGARAFLQDHDRTCRRCGCSTEPRISGRSAHAGTNPGRRHRGPAFPTAPSRTWDALKAPAQETAGGADRFRKAAGQASTGGNHSRFS